MIGCGVSVTAHSALGATGCQRASDLSRYHRISCRLHSNHTTVPELGSCFHWTTEHQFLWRRLEERQQHYQNRSFLKEGTLPSDDQKAKKVTSESHLFTLVDDILYYLDPKQGDQKRTVVPKQL